jgi:hypothetical protein
MGQKLSSNMSDQSSAQSLDQQRKREDFAFSRARREVHEVENSGDTPSDFLRVEFKTQPAGESSLRGRYYREFHLSTENYQKVQFENEQIRISRIICVAGQGLNLASDSGQPSLFVALTAGSLSVSDLKGSSSKLEIQPGQTKWFGSEQPQSFTNLVASNAEFLRFDFKNSATTNGALIRREPATDLRAARACAGPTSPAAARFHSDHSEQHAAVQ